MTDKFSIEFNPSSSASLPHDLLARLYREIGISAVAAALEAHQFSEKQAQQAKADDRRLPPLLLGDDLAA